MKAHGFRLGLTVATAALLAPLPVHAADVVVGSGTTLTTKQILGAAGDTLTVEVGGLIDVSGNNAVEAPASGVSVSISGTVISDQSAFVLISSRNKLSSTGLIKALDHGVFILGTGNSVANAGTVSASEVGIAIHGGSNSIVNTGLIHGGQHGIDAYGLSTIVNSGTVIADTSVGIYASFSSVVYNAGVIEAGGSGIGILNDNNIVTNSGSISGGESGIGIAGHGNSVVNTGLIHGGQHGIDAHGLNTIVNSGTVIADISTGIYASFSSVVYNAGAIEAGGSGIGILNDNNIVTNSGSISAGESGIGIAGHGNSVVNTGLIHGGQHGIDAYGLNTIVNSGTVIADTGVGIYASFSSVVYNAGVIEAGRPGIGILNDNNIVTNSGSISGGESGIGILGDDNSIVNTGLLHGDSVGILGHTGAAGNSVINSGTIEGDDIGVIFDSGNAVISSGTIRGSSAAVKFTGSGNSLSLLKGNIVEGLLVMGSGNSLSLVRGVNAAYSYSGDPAVRSSGSGPLADTGSVVVTLDRSGFSAPEDMMDDLARIIADQVDARLLSLRTEDGGPGTGLWLQALGSSRAEQGFDLLTGGGMAGADHEVGAGHAGGFAGLARGRSRFDNNSEDLTSTSYFGGLYGDYAFPRIVLNAALTGGFSTFDGSRDIYDNMSGGGTGQVDWHSTGLFASPAVTVSFPLEVDAGTLIPSLRGRYGGMRVGNHTEHWASIDLDVDSRMVHLLDMRGQMAWLGTFATGGLGQLDVTLRAGGDLTVSRGGDVQIDLASAVMDFAGGDDGLEARGFVGFDIGLKPGLDTTVSLSGTLGVDRSGALSMDTGLRVARPL